MAGSNQAANLGGMISQIAGTLGTKVDAEPYTRGIENTFRPDADPTDLASMRNLYGWQQKMGRGEEARNTMVGIRDLETAEKEQKQIRQGQARSAAINEYDKAMKTGDANAIAAAEDAVYKVGEVQGVDVTGMLSGVEQRSYALARAEAAKREETYQTTERERAANVRKEANKVAQALNSATTIEAADKALADAPLEVAGAAAEIHGRAVARLDSDRARAQMEADARAPLIKAAVNIPEGIPEDTTKGITLEQNSLNIAIDALNAKIEKGDVLIPKSERDALTVRRRRLEDRVVNIVDSRSIRNDERAYAQGQELDKQIRNLEVGKRAPLDSTFVSTLANAIAGVDKDGKRIPATTEDIVKARSILRRDRDRAIDNQINYLRTPADTVWPEIGDVADGSVYIGGDPSDPESWKPQEDEPVLDVDPASLSYINQVRSKITPKFVAPEVEPAVVPEGTPDYVRYDRDKVNSVRSKITPLGSGKYTYNGGTQ